MHMNMPPKNVALRTEVIALLDGEKRPGESYSDVILRLIPARRPFHQVLEELRRRPPVESDDLTRRVEDIRRHNNLPRRMRG